MVFERGAFAGTTNLIVSRVTIRLDIYVTIRADFGDNLHRVGFDDPKYLSIKPELTAPALFIFEVLNVLEYGFDFDYQIRHGYRLLSDFLLHPFLPISNLNLLFLDLSQVLDRYLISLKLV